jgi:hypothetical protein
VPSGWHLANPAHPPHMKDQGIEFGLQSMCEGGGMANAAVLELL